MPASKVTWVRSDGCSKYIASVRPAQRLRALALAEQRLQLPGAREDREQLLGGPVVEVEEVLGHLSA